MLSSQRLARRVTLVETVPVPDLPFPVLPAEVHHPALALVREVDQTRADVLDDTAQLRDLGDPSLHARGLRLQPSLRRLPPRPVEDAASGHGQPLLLAAQPVARLRRLRL